MSEEKVQVSRKTFDAACVFAGATLAQILVPRPLDYFLFPTAAAVWFVHSGQDSWMIDYAYNNAKALGITAKALATDFINQHRQKAIANLTDDDEE